MPCCSKSSKKRSLCSDQRLEGNNSILYIGIKNTVFNAYIPNAPNTLLGSVLPGIPNPRTQSYLQKGFVRILADKLPFLREYPYVSNHIYTWIHWTMSGENSMFSTISIPVVSVGLFGVWRGEHFSTTGGLNSYQNSFWKIFKPAFWMIISRLRKKNSHPNGDYQLSLNTECNQTKNATSIFFTKSQVIVVQLCISVYIISPCFLVLTYIEIVFFRTSALLPFAGNACPLKKNHLSGRASTGKSSNPLVTINAVLSHISSPNKFQHGNLKMMEIPKGICSTRRSCCGSVSSITFTNGPMVLGNNR